MHLCDVSLVEILHLEFLEADVELLLDFAEHAVFLLPAPLLLKLDPGFLCALRLDDLGIARMVRMTESTSSRGGRRRFAKSSSTKRTGTGSR